ncbi:hypothetical protein LAB17_002093 [Salmonella enterica subsp. enterica serovar Newport]|nr:hypothetical protein [Salmonella enterica subsp. enterica serovar Panama]ECN8988798.1 hypothetical protein [Salmonella enterica subsp. enterica serovar Corvallis]EDA7160077.1 hypothetical protein [Salmonella enterica subsp. enterica serovar Enteritidis]EFD5177262.1 hypothetical protein [Escherichia coli]EIC2604739.1 hypothetical protein [Salmonella enterica subsp. enterica serovar Newport]
MQQRIGLSLAIDRLIKVSSLRSEFSHVREEAANNRFILTFTCTKKGVTVIRDVWSAVNKREARCSTSVVDYKNLDNTYTIRLEWEHRLRTFVEVRSKLLAELLNEACLRDENATELFRTL